MRMYRLKQKDGISRNQSRQMIVKMGTRGKHNWRYLPNAKFETEEDIRRFYAANEYDFDQIVEVCRDPSESVFLFENLLGSTMMLGDVEVQTDTCRSRFETAEEALSRAISNTSSQDLQVAVTFGIASIDAYVGYRAELWNRDNPGTPLLDTRDNPVRFETKIDEWIPLMTGGKRLDKSSRVWPDFKILRGIRDNEAIHAKSSSAQRRIADLAEAINKFKFGIAGFLIQLHDLFNEEITTEIIRAYYAPEVEVIEQVAAEKAG